MLPNKDAEPAISLCSFIRLRRHASTFWLSKAKTASIRVHTRSRIIIMYINTSFTNFTENAKMCYEQIMKRHHYMQIVSAIFISLPSNVDARFWLNSVHLNSPSSRSRWWRRVRRFIVLHLINSSSRRRFCSCSSFAETSMTKTDICHQMQKVVAVHAHTHPFNGPLSGTTRVSRYKTNLDFTEARDSEWQWHQLGRMQVCTSLQTDNHASTPPLCFYRPDALPAAQPTASQHWRPKVGAVPRAKDRVADATYRVMVRIPTACRIFPMLYNGRKAFF